MDGGPAHTEMLRKAFDSFVAQADCDARKLAALAQLAAKNGPVHRVYDLAMRARALAPDDPDVRSMTDICLSAGVPSWHFRIVRDTHRNDSYEAALRRAVRPDSRVLDIGAGTGLLGMMAARAGAAEVASCEMNAPVAAAAAHIVAQNGLAERVRIIPKHSKDLDAEADLGGRVDILVQEIVANNVVGEDVLPAMEHAVRQFLKPGGVAIPRSAAAQVALCAWPDLEKSLLGEVSGFDLSGFNPLLQRPIRLPAGEPGLELRSTVAALFDFDFESGGPYPNAADVDLTAEGGAADGIVQWLRLQMDESGVYENAPGRGWHSAWACLFYPFSGARTFSAGETVRVHGAHSAGTLRLWVD
ncbi:50S ribosomal protein L11 methyltransferase [Aquabacter spiritensis]|uniref:Ribosomal protein L11 methyltransferase PrmA n=1 Tax=Aquabacter spiritensis TaxID=933073 RepID=A0A4R3LU43_9HYPH|nr:50S ribosomal protein L11 methyltransferase [Aquabacter spiritensis]TCT03991.1 ribosomal protein L11 methyltransferase PrmA [Aquabacter spiritensis]